MGAPVAVTGMGVVCAIAADVPSFAAALRAGRRGVVRQPDPESPGGAWPVAPVRDFDLAAALGALTALPAAARARAGRVAARSPEPVQVALAVAAQAWLEAQLAGGAVPPDRIGLVVGGNNLTTGYAYQHHATYRREPSHLPARYPLQVQDTDHVGVLSHALGITGEGCTVGASSASGNAALIHASRMVATGAAQVCLAVGALSRLAPPDRYALAKLGALASGGAAGGGAAGGGAAGGPFDRDRDGFVPGEAAACLVVEPASSAHARGVPVLAELAGSAAVLAGTSLSDPSAGAQARAIHAALAGARVDAGQLDYVNAHATGTPAGDQAELAALARVLGGCAGRPWLNSTKALVGHCLSAAGMVEAVATVIQMRDGFVHPNPSLRHPSETGFRYAGRCAAPARIDTALSNSAGFGGFHSSVVFRRG